MILLCEPPAAAVGAKVENRGLVFQARQRVFCTGRLEARAPNQLIGLVCRGGPAKGTRGLLSMRTISGYGVCVRSIQ